MRKLVVLLTCAVVVNSSSARKRSPEFEEALIKGAQMKMVFSVHDDEGFPVESAKVRAVVEKLYTIYNLWGETDTNGTCVVEGVTTGNRIEIFVEKDGYYKTHKKYCFITMGAEHEVKDGKWQPYGAEERLELRRIRDPIELIHFYEYVDIPMTNVWIGVDMMKRELVRPFGNGEYADLELKVDWDGQSPPRSKFCACEVRFARPHSFGRYERKVLESEYPYVYAANVRGAYEVMFVRVVDREIDDRGNRLRHPLRNDSSLVFRTRCEWNERGELTSAHYGMLRALGISPGWNNKPSTILIDYLLNPTPNDTNLEAKQ